MSFSNIGINSLRAVCEVAYFTVLSNVGAWLWAEQTAYQLSSLCSILCSVNAGSQPWEFTDTGSCFLCSGFHCTLEIRSFKPRLNLERRGNSSCWNCMASKASPGQRELELARGWGGWSLGGLCRQSPAAALWCEVSPKVVHDFVRQVQMEEKGLQNSTFTLSGQVLGFFLLSNGFILLYLTPVKDRGSSLTSMQIKE